MTSADPTDTDNEVQVDESTALLAHAGEQPASQDDHEQSAAEDKPLAKDQILFLCFARFVEPVAFFCIFPFISQMIWETGTVAETDVGFYSGLIESLFSLTQMCFMIPWGKAADTFGRKPVLIISLTGVSVATAAFGLSKTVWQMIVIRCFGGLFAGTIVTIRAMITENSTPKTQARAFSIFAFAGNLGLFLGPITGGALAKPATEFPSVFGKIKFFRDFPYALPTLVTGAIGGLATILCAIGVKETLAKCDSTKPDASKKMSTLEIIRAPNVGITLYINAHVMILAFSFTAILPVFYFTPVHLGGFGLSPLMISGLMALGGISQALWLLIAFPILQGRYGTKWVMKACAWAYPFMFGLYPAFNVMLRCRLTTLFWATAPPMLALGSGVAMSFTCVQLLLNDVSPGPEVLGTLNALALTLVSGLRAFSPGTFASLFAASVRSRIIGGHLIWILMVAWAVGFTVVSYWVPEVDKDAKKTNGHTEEESDIR